MSDAKTSVRVIVKATMRIELDDRWGGDCSLHQVHRQAAESTRVKLQQITQANPWLRFNHSPEVVEVIIEGDLE